MPSAPSRIRVYLEDARRNGSYARVTWHADRQVFVISHWRDRVCVAATQVPREAAAELVALVADALATRPPGPQLIGPPPPPTGPPPPLPLRVRARRLLDRVVTRAPAEEPSGTVLEYRRRSA